MSVEETGPDLLAEDRAVVAEFIASLRESVAEEPAPRAEPASHEGLAWGWRSAGQSASSAAADADGKVNAAGSSIDLTGRARSKRGFSWGRAASTGGDVAPAASVTDLFDASGSWTEAPSLPKSSAADSASPPSPNAASSKVAGVSVRKQAAAAAPNYRWHNAAIVTLLILCAILAYLAFA